ncbi:MAG: hypothetical protein E7585_03815 [Ruminococcaceae bacterium]|nr:hypothetical protein [Oscillospiraceae bacterium]
MERHLPFCQNSAKHNGGKRKYFPYWQHHLCGL